MKVTITKKEAEKLAEFIMDSSKKQEDKIEIEFEEMKGGLK